MMSEKYFKIPLKILLNLIFLLPSDTLFGDLHFDYFV